MDIYAVLWISLVVFGFILSIVELFVLPGTSVIGIAGITAMIYGIVRIFTDMGNTAGWIALITVLIVCTALIVWFFKTKSWKKISLDDQLGSKVNLIDRQKIKVGDSGNALSRLAPMGQADFSGEIVEVQSIHGFIDQKTPVKIVKIENSKVFVVAE